MVEAASPITRGRGEGDADRATPGIAGLLGQLRDLGKVGLKPGTGDTAHHSTSFSPAAVNLKIKKPEAPETVNKKKKPNIVFYGLVGPQHPSSSGDVFTQC